MWFFVHWTCLVIATAEIVTYVIVGVEGRMGRADSTKASEHDWAIRRTQARRTDVPIGKKCFI